MDRVSLQLSLCFRHLFIDQTALYLHHRRRMEEKKRADVKVWHSNPSVPVGKNEDDQFDGEIINTITPAEVVIPEVIETEEEQRNSRIFGNRAIVCLLALGLLWVTSLQNAIGIINAYIKAPSLNTVISVCRQSYDIVSEEKVFFGECVSGQLTKCNKGLTAEYFVENDKKKSYEVSNAAMLLSLQRR
jgi:hypothetical protein